MNKFNLMSSIDILDLSIPSTIIFYIFIIIGAVAFFLYIFNLIFKKNSKKKNNVINDEEMSKEEFEIQKNDIENEISLILRSEKEDGEVNQNESK